MVEVVTLAPAVGLLVMLIFAGGRTAVAHQATEAAAAEAARAASIARTQATAEGRARDAAVQSLTDQGLNCVTSAVDVDVAAFAAAVGTAASVGATVACAVPMGDLVLPGMPGSITVSATMRSPLDTYRER
ncbi:TadE/TadG family type IV pilus assembly protein [Cellulomonas chitinilytica]|uniref:TadE/TadG family type IV pilus assembly protein n=1 Tax=Cellulomonas chitinilytica TaxID=398759 RepID=UPI001EF26036|nr:TadE/TadG family type IV pilus assembly protein [Cellulomonas chitinilytica]